MTENEAKQWLKHTRAYQHKCDNCEYIDIKGACNEECKDFYDMAIQALEEIQQYRAIGTVERFEQLSKQFAPHNVDETSCHLRQCNKCDMYRKENEKYHEIGTVEEFKALKENKFFNFDSPVARVDKKSYNKAIDDLCNEFRKDWEEQCENDMEDCINWYDWLIACAEQLKGE